MELTKIEEIINSIEKSDLYIICPKVFSGKIIDNKVFKITRIIDYHWSYVALCGGRYFSIYSKENIHEKINADTEINTTARIFTEKSEAERVVKDVVKTLSYDAIKGIDEILNSIKERKRKLNRKEEKYKALRKEYFEMSLSKFAK